jgi:hypothetical protein
MWNVSFKIIFLLLALCGATGAQAQISKKKYYPSSREEYKDYGGKVSVGFSIGGLGIPVRFYATPLHVFEVNAELIGAIIQNNFERGSQLRARACLGASYTFLTDPFFIAKTTRKGVTIVKLKKQGFAFRYNTLFSSKPDTQWKISEKTTKKVHLPSSWVSDTYLHLYWKNHEENHEGRQLLGRIFVSLGVVFMAPRSPNEDSLATSSSGIQIFATAF